jgi:hypothetical protein
MGARLVEAAGEISMDQKLDLMRDASRDFPSIDQPLSIRKLRVWHCKYRSLTEISRMTNLEELVIASLPDESFDFLAQLRSLRYLSVTHFPKIKSIEPLGVLSALNSISLATSPSWDSANRVLEIDSLQPLLELKSLRHVELFGVRAKDGSLRILEALKSLETAKFSQYPQEEVDRFFQETKVKVAFNPESSF